jgi:hypothetical protein
MGARVSSAYESLRAGVTGCRRNTLKEIWSEFRRQPLPSLNPQETDPAGALAKADKQKLKTGD